MKLKLLYEDHWEPIGGHPGKLGELDSRSKKNKKRKSFLVHPKDRERFMERMGLDGK
jgi:hypothetical protein